MSGTEITPEERLLLAIFGLHDGETVEEAVAEMRAATRQAIAETPTTGLARAEEDRP